MSYMLVVVFVANKQALSSCLCRRSKTCSSCVFLDSRPPVVFLAAFQRSFDGVFGANVGLCSSFERYISAAERIRLWELATILFCDCRNYPSFQVSGPFWWRSTGWSAPPRPDCRSYWLASLRALFGQSSLSSSSLAFGIYRSIRWLRYIVFNRPPEYVSVHGTWCLQSLFFFCIPEAGGAAPTMVRRGTMHCSSAAGPGLKARPRQ